MRCSLSDNYLQELSAKIRHFYDLHFLVKDSECLEYLEGEDFKNDFEVLLSHDRALFSKPHSWQDKDIADSPLLTDMNGTWSELQETYSKEMPDLAYKVIPEGGEILESIKKILERIS